MSKPRNNIFLTLMLITFMLLINTLGCAQDQGVLFLENQFWNPDSSHSFEYKEYSLGTSGGYQTIEINGQEILRFDFAVVYGGWVNIETIKIVSSDPPQHINIEGIDLNIIAEQAETYNDYKKDSYLKHLAK